MKRWACMFSALVMMVGCQAQRPPQSQSAGTTPTVLDVSGPRPPRQPSVYVVPAAAYGGPAASSGPAYLPPDGSDLSAVPAGSYAAPPRPAAAISMEAAPKTAGVHAKTYLVKRGDTLFRIAKEHYGSGSQWKRIAAANPGLTPATLKAGQKLLMP